MGNNMAIWSAICFRRLFRPPIRLHCHSSALSEDYAAVKSTASQEICDSIAVKLLDPREVLLGHPDASGISGALHRRYRASQDGEEVSGSRSVGYTMCLGKRKDVR